MNIDSYSKVAAAYIRVSDERQDEYSPDSQLKKIREYASKEGCFIPDEYVFYDDGISGRNAKRRNEFNRMIAIAKEKDRLFDVIYVWKFSRFARNQEESMVYKNLLKKKGVSVVSVSEPIPEGHYGTLIERIIEWMDEFYSINLGVEVTRGMTEKASRGEPTCAPPFGYIMRDKKYYPDESGAADAVREIFERFVNGDGMREIAVDLANKGFRTRRGNPPDNRWVSYILNNPCYIGKIRWSLDGTKAASKRDYDNESIMVSNGHHEPLVSMELWDLAQSRIKALKKAYPKHARSEQSVEYMFKGLVRCSSCGGTLACGSATSGKAKTPTLQCCNYSRGSCHISHSVVMTKITASLISGLEEAVGSKEFKIIPTTAKKAKADAIDYDKMIAVEEKRLERAKEAYLAEIDTIEQYAKNKNDISARISKLKKARDAEQPKDNDIDLDALSKKVSEVIAFIKRTDVSEKAKNQALRTIIAKMVYDKPHENLAIYFHEV